MPALLGLCYLCICVFIAIFGYLLAPDSTRYANQQILELAKKPPGTQVKILKVPINSFAETNPTEDAGSWLWGKSQDFIPIALNKEELIEERGDFLRFTRLSGVIDSVSLSTFEGSSSSWASHLEERTYRFGTDSYGRDVLSRILLGTRVSLSVGLLSVLISLTIGISLGSFAGFWGGWIDRVIVWLLSVLWSIPTLLLALALSFVLGKGFWQVFVAIGLSMWVDVARIVRGQILSVREELYVEAARALGLSDLRILFRHILPNILNPIIVIAVANFGAAVLIESGLSFLGIGVEVPIPSWGRMVYEGYTFIIFESGKWLAFYPGIALISLVVSINLVGIGLRDALDVKM